MSTRGRHIIARVASAACLLLVALGVSGCAEIPAGIDSSLHNRITVPPARLLADELDAAKPEAIPPGKATSAPGGSSLPAPNQTTAPLPEPNSSASASRPLSGATASAIPEHLLPAPASEPVVLPAPAGPLTLEMAIDLATQYSPRLGVMRARIAAAEGGREVAMADFFPEAMGTLRHIEGDPGSHPFVLPTMTTEVGGFAPSGASDRFDRAELGVQWILYDFGRTSGRVGQARTAVEIARLQLDRARESVTFDVTKAYFSVLQAQANTRIAEEGVALASSTLRDARNYFRRGAMIRNDVLRADVLLAEMQLNLVRAQTERGAAVAALNQAIGTNVSCPTTVVDRTEEPAFRLPLADCLQLAADNRDEFRVAINEIRGTNYGIGVAKAEFMPRILVGGVALQQDADGLPHDKTSAIGGVSLELALFEGGRRIGKLRTAQAEMRGAIALGREICDRIAYEVNLAYLAIQDARQRVELSRTTVAQASENLRVVQRLLEHGDATPTELVDAVLTMTRAKQNYATALYDYQTSLARLAFATGLPNTPGLSASLFASSP
ncbi:MAG: TolC family protein [Pirellulales bacterium]|nr:TolC family protein [Pirellulales bacterium]